MTSTSPPIPPKATKIAVRLGPSLWEVLARRGRTGGVETTGLGTTIVRRHPAQITCEPAW